MDQINQAVKRYNQALDYCYQRCEDLAVLQLKKAIEMHPTYVKAYQLLALLYIMDEQYSEARKNIRIAHKLDKTDDITMRYMHELNQVRKSRNVRLVDDKDTGKKKKRRQTDCRMERTELCLLKKKWGEWMDSLHGTMHIS